MLCTQMTSGAYRLEWVSDTGAGVPEVRARAIRSREQLDDALDEIERHARANEPLIVDLISPLGASLRIGLGRQRSVLTFDSGSGMPPYLESSGDETNTNSDSIVFYYGGHWTEFPASALIPKEAAREAMKSFFQTGERPNNVSWEEV